MQAGQLRYMVGRCDVDGEIRRLWGVCNGKECHKLRGLLVEMVGADWRRALFGDKIPEETDLQVF